MSTPTNELDALLMGSLQQLSADFQERETRLNAEYASCVEVFMGQSNELSDQYNEVSRRLDELTKHYINTQALMQRIVTQLNALSSRLK
jgi:ABC-type transporter Mla subunit MlaD